MTVVIALAALTLSGMPILAEMGLVAAATVAVAVVVAVTVSPAVLGLMGPRVVSRRGWRRAGWDCRSGSCSPPARATKAGCSDWRPNWNARFPGRTFIPRTVPGP